MSDQLCEDSWILYHVLDRLIGGRPMVTISRRLTLINDLLYNASAVSQVQLSTGSSAEGILMKGSDKDSMLIDKMVIILDFDQESLSITSDLRNESVFIMRDSNDRPGYVNLELINMRQQPPAMLLESIVPFGNSHFLSSALYTRCAAFILSTVFQVPIETHGPSTPLLNEKSKVGSDMDIVCAFSCSSWPVVAHEWVTRSRMYNWPVASLRDQIVNGGCYVVPVGDKTSEYAFMQWRISFASAERKLIHSFSHVQFLVYCLLKYLFKQVSDRLKDIYGDEDIISSYILKTVVFHALETTPTSLWQEKNTFLCFMLCLKMLSAYVKAGHCPNYFIYKHNMFLGKVCGNRQQKLYRFLGDIHDMAWGSLSIGTFIKPTVGDHIDQVKRGEWEAILIPSTRSEKECDLKIIRETLQPVHNYSAPGSLKLLCNLLYKSESDMDDFIAYYGLVNGMSVEGMETFANDVCDRGNKGMYKSLRRSKRLLTPLVSACSSQGILPLATYHFQTGNYQKSLEMCGQVITYWKLYVNDHLSMKDEIRYEHLCCGRGYTLLQKCQIACSSDIKITKNSSRMFPYQLQPELERCTLGRLTISPVPYAIFLSFLCYHELGDTRRRDKTLTNLQIIKYDEVQGVRKFWIVHNLIGICYEMVGDISGALREYRASINDQTPLQCLNPAKERIARLAKYQSSGAI
ncbi:uncharacterized protein [Argopecten irradians]|uniref:uncharacterized protein n=1 Tax=Argopecten irradians TaxID=31199 RepID=UPI003723EE35